MSTILPHHAKEDICDNLAVRSHGSRIRDLLNYSLPVTTFVFSEASGGPDLMLSKDTCTTDDLNLPCDGMYGYNRIYWGFSLDDSAGTKMNELNGDTGKEAST